MIRAIIIDLDGTTLPRGWNSLSEENKKALEEAGCAGITRVLATGRSVFSFRNALPEGLPIDYMVFSSGAGIMHWNDQRLLCTRELSPEETLDIATMLWEYDINFTIQQPIPDNHHFLYRNTSPLHEDFRRRVENYPGLGTSIQSTRDIRGGATQFLVILDSKQLQLHGEIQEKLSGYSVIRSTSPIDNQAIWTEIFARDVNKGSSCQILLDQLDIRYDECAGLGNDYNDIDFLERCGHPFIVANAPEPLRGKFNNVTSDTNNGLAEFIHTALTL
ncbi:MULTISPECIES: HAD-IIB family hydrolase [Butyricimonas]|uniref:HAD-IIB family hydrolase n=1 Tax=Butyricimonas TaxID=574697 RepID=UPI001D07938A|nr:MULTISPECIES: HAD family hydrolase [Butyricimonas]MCB6974030.1 Cof-type HAD-IIB family hydrolase [Butyricimonas synergistica]MCG4520908.1 Cof-type HAD-IIB family hydrolase [Butyricimonas sp. DFI.6.44]